MGKVFAVITNHLDCTTYIDEEKVKWSTMIEQSLKDEAFEERGEIQLLTEKCAQSLYERYEKRLRKEAKNGKAGSGSTKTE